MATIEQQLTHLKRQLAAEKARADAAENLLYDRYFVAVLTGLAARYDFETPPRRLIEVAERLTLAALEARRIYKAGHSPNTPPANGRPVARGPTK